MRFIFYAAILLLLSACDKKLPFHELPTTSRPKLDSTVDIDSTVPRELGPKLPFEATTKLIHEAAYPVRILHEDGSVHGFRYLKHQGDVCKISAGKDYMPLPEVGDIEWEEFNDFFIYRNTLFISIRGVEMDTSRSFQAYEFADKNEDPYLPTLYYILVNLNTGSVVRFNYPVAYYDHRVSHFERFTHLLFQQDSKAQSVIHALEIDCNLTQIVCRKAFDISALNYGSKGHYDLKKYSTEEFFVTSSCRLNHNDFSILIQRYESNSGLQSESNKIVPYLLVHGQIRFVPELHGMRQLFSTSRNTHAFIIPTADENKSVYDSIYIYSISGDQIKLERLLNVPCFGEKLYCAGRQEVRTIFASKRFLFLQYGGDDYGIEVVDMAAKPLTFKKYNEANETAMLAPYGP